MSTKREILKLVTGLNSVTPLPSLYPIRYCFFPWKIKGSRQLTPKPLPHGSKVYLFTVWAARVYWLSSFSLRHSFFFFFIKSFLRIAIIHAYFWADAEFSTTGVDEKRNLHKQQPWKQYFPSVSWCLSTRQYILYTLHLSLRPSTFTISRSSPH